jgi:hypothetical protein
LQSKTFPDQNRYSISDTMSRKNQKGFRRLRSSEHSSESDIEDELSSSPQTSDSEDSDYGLQSLFLEPESQPKLTLKQAEEMVAQYVERFRQPPVIPPSPFNMPDMEQPEFGAARDSLIKIMIHTRERFAFNRGTLIWALHMAGLIDLQINRRGLTRRLFDNLIDCRDFLVEGWHVLRDAVSYIKRFKCPTPSGFHPIIDLAFDQLKQVYPRYFHEASMAEVIQVSEAQLAAAVDALRSITWLITKGLLMVFEEVPVTYPVGPWDVFDTFHPHRLLQHIVKRMGNAVVFLVWTFKLYAKGFHDDIDHRGKHHLLEEQIDITIKFYQELMTLQPWVYRLAEVYMTQLDYWNEQLQGMIERGEDQSRIDYAQSIVRSYMTAAPARQMLDYLVDNVYPALIMMIMYKAVRRILLRNARNITAGNDDPSSSQFLCSIADNVLDRTADGKFRCFPINSIDDWLNIESIHRRLTQCKGFISSDSAYIKRLMKDCNSNPRLKEVVDLAWTRVMQENPDLDFIKDLQFLLDKITEEFKRLEARRLAMQQEMEKYQEEHEEEFDDEGHPIGRELLRPTPRAPRPMTTGRFKEARRKR